MSENHKYRLTDGLVRQNVVLMSGVAIAPVAVCAVSYDSAVAVATAFTVIVFLSVALCRVIPDNMAGYGVRVAIYALIAGLTTIPAYILVSYLYGEQTAAELGVYLPIMAVNPLILSKTETRFKFRPPHFMFLELAGYITGFNFVCIAVGSIREILATKRIGLLDLNMSFDVPAASTAFGGLIIVGLAAGIFRWRYNRYKEKQLLKLEKERKKQRLLEEINRNTSRTVGHL